MFENPFFVSALSGTVPILSGNTIQILSQKQDQVTGLLTKRENLSRLIVGSGGQSAPMKKGADLLGPCKLCQPILSEM